MTDSSLHLISIQINKLAVCDVLELFALGELGYLMQFCKCQPKEALEEISELTKLIKMHYLEYVHENLCAISSNEF